jgi:hypothetical protein
MKTKTIWTICLLFLGSSLAIQAQDTPFKDFLKQPLVKTSFITKPMLDLAKDTEVGNITIGDLANRLEQVETYSNVRTGSQRYLATGMKRMATEQVERNNYNLILSLTEGNKVITFYSKTPEGEKEIISDLIMMSYIPDNMVGQFSLIRLTGRLTFDDLRRIHPVKK